MWLGITLLLLNLAPNEVYKPQVLPLTRWSLTPPFHPYPSCGGRYDFCCTVCRKAGLCRKNCSCLFSPGYYPAFFPKEPGLFPHHLPLSSEADKAVISYLLSTNYSESEGSSSESSSSSISSSRSSSSSSDKSASSSYIPDSS